MKKYFAVWGILLLIPFFCTGTPLKKGVIPGKEVFLLLDVRSVTEYRTGHLHTAVNLPLDSLEKKIRLLAAKKDTPIYVYCRSGRRSANAVKVLRKMDYTKLYDLGGMTEAKKKLSLPIMK